MPDSANDVVCIIIESRCRFTIFINARITYEKTKGKFPESKLHSSSL